MRADVGTVDGGQTKPDVQEKLMEAIVSKANMGAAYRRVKKNGGAAGVDGMTTEALAEHLRQHWPVIREKLLAGTYIPQAVRRVEIPKPNGGVRVLGIPTVMDRLIQQAMNQVLQPVFEPGFSDASFGFRPQRSAQQAIERAHAYVAEGKVWVVDLDLDLEAFFDRVNHDILMSRVARQVEDKRVLKLIRRYLEAGMMEGGLESPRREGTPQGGPLSPLLSNVLLTDLDQEIEKRGLSHCRYADDCNVYVKTQKSGERGNGRPDRVSGEAAQAQGEHCQERGREILDAEVSRLHLERA